MEKNGTFDYILLETTGLADPGNLAPLFWVDEGLGSSIYLDGIVTLVDAKNILYSLDEPSPEHQQPGSSASSGLGESQQPSHDAHQGPEMSTAHLQISHADVVVINKSDLVTADQLQAVQQRILSINGVVKIHVTEHSRVPQLEGVLLDLHAYDNVDATALDFAAKGHSHLDPAISTVSLTLPRLDASQISKLEGWLQSLLWTDLFLTHPDAEGGATSAGDRTDIHRIKGRLPMTDGGLRLLQGVREVFEILEAPNASPNQSVADDEQGKIVVIGRNIGGDSGRMRLQHNLAEALTAP